MSQEPEPGTALATIDFSKEAIAKAVLWNTSLGSPVVTSTTALGVVGFVAILTAGAPFWAAAPILLGLGWFGFNYFIPGRRDSIAANYLQQFNAMTRDQSKQMAVFLTGEFAELGFDRGKEQIALLQKNLATIKTLLGDKFDKGDVSYEQFLGPAETLVAKTMNVLKDAAAQLRANQTYDSAYERKTAGKQKSANGSADRRRQLYEDGTKHFDELMEKVESAITGLAELTHDVARIGSDAGSHDDFIQRVRDIASRAGLYVDEKRI